MQDDLFEVLRRTISAERLASYSRIGEDDAGSVLANYLWNLALSESLYPSLQSLEIALRNSINSAASEVLGNVWWFDDSGSILRQQDRSHVEEAKTKLLRDKKPIEVGRVIAELNFGFWTSLLDARYEQVLWPKLLKPVFPHMPRQIRTRKEASRRLNKIRKLRNRVFHYEPIWHWKDLMDQHSAILEFIGWIDPMLSDVTRPIDRFTDVQLRGVGPYRELLARIARERTPLEHKVFPSTH